MDQINSNPHFNTSRLYQSYQSQPKPATPATAAGVSKATELPSSTQSHKANNDYSTLFDDDALLKLQSNLEAIAQMAEQSLKRIDA